MNMVPPPSGALVVIVPPWRRMTSDAVYKPRPKPGATLTASGAR